MPPTFFFLEALMLWWLWCLIFNSGSVFNDFSVNLGSQLGLKSIWELLVRPLARPRPKAKGVLEIPRVQCWSLLVRFETMLVSFWKRWDHFGPFWNHLGCQIGTKIGLEASGEPHGSPNSPRPKGPPESPMLDQLCDHFWNQHRPTNESNSLCVVESFGMRVYINKFRYFSGACNDGSRQKHIFIYVNICKVGQSIVCSM